jgi:predicted nucleic acid-binding protein
MTVVADASPLIALARIGRLALLHSVFGRLLLPEAVWREVVEAGMAKPGAGEVWRAGWIERRSVRDAGLVALLRHNLGAGESEAIVLAREAGADLVLLDDRMGRAAATRLGLRVVGLVGVLVEARERGLLPDPETVANELHQAAGFWLSNDLREIVIGEKHPANPAPSTPPTAA